jgi:hypothetical protein
MPAFPDLPAISNAPLSVILLAQGEIPGEASARTWLNVLEPLKRDYEIIVTGPFGMSEQPESSQALASPHPTIRTLAHSTSVGIGTVLGTAIAAARFPLLVYADVNSGNVRENLDNCLATIDKVHLVSGRRESITSRRLPRWNGLPSRLCIRMIFGVHLTDPACPFKLFRREIFDRIPIQSKGSFVHIEILAKANFLGKLMTEVAVKGQRSEVTSRRSQVGSQRYSGKWRDAWLVFRDPDFGPAILATARTATESYCERLPHTLP